MDNTSKMLRLAMGKGEDVTVRIDAERVKAMDETSLMQTARNYGITDSIEKMSAASKVQLRFLTMIQQYKRTP